MTSAWVVPGKRAASRGTASGRSASASVRSRATARGDVAPVEVGGELARQGRRGQVVPRVAHPRTVVRLTGVMPTPIELHARRSIPVGVDAAYDAVLPMPLPRIFSRRFLALPPIREVRDQAGAWGTVGQTRTIVLADRGTMRETLTSRHARHELRLRHRAAHRSAQATGGRCRRPVGVRGGGCRCRGVVALERRADPRRGAGHARLRPDVAGLRSAGARGDRAGPAGAAVEDAQPRIAPPERP